MSEGGGKESGSNSDNDTEEDPSNVAMLAGGSYSDRTVGLPQVKKSDEEQSLREFVASEGIEVQESDIYVTEMLTEDVCHFTKKDDIKCLEKGILYEFPEENEEQDCDTLPQTYFDNLWSIPLEQVVKITAADVSELRSLDKTIEKEMVKHKQIKPCEFLERKDGDFIVEKIFQVPETPAKTSSKIIKIEKKTDNKIWNKVYKNTEAEKNGAFVFGCKKQDKKDLIFSSDGFRNAEVDSNEIPSESLKIECTNINDNVAIDSYDCSTDTEDNTDDLPSGTMQFKCTEPNLSDGIFSSDSSSDSEDNTQEILSKVFLFGYRQRNINETIYSSDGFADIEDNAQESSPDKDEANSTVNSNTNNIVSDNFLFNIDAPQQTGQDYIFNRATFGVKRNSNECESDQNMKKSRISVLNKTKRNAKNSTSNIVFKDPGSSYIPTCCNPQQSNITLSDKRSNGSIKIFKSNMPTITEIPEKKDAKENKIANDSKASTSTTLKMKRKSSIKEKCGVCNVRLGLCAIRCRCGNLYCAKHRYDKEHNCTFDYKAMGAEEIRKNNPKVIAEKIRKL